MNIDAIDITWHYVLDIHESDEIWYSLPYLLWVRWSKRL